MASDKGEGVIRVKNARVKRSTIADAESAMTTVFHALEDMQCVILEGKREGGVYGNPFWEMHENGRTMLDLLAESKALLAEEEQEMDRELEE
jgi:hypothetical protein